ncbi:MAG: hypothetical protein RLZ98_404 [Pseudomonadota bacterium]|jgi:tRNA modification GTPase
MVETVFALSSAPGRAGVAVIRASGAAAGKALCQLTGKPLPVPRTAVVRVLKDPRNGEDIDRAIVLWMPGPGSFTGEDTAEFHVHGGRAVVAAMLDALGAVEGCRLAEPGEFARRAFEAGRIDLTEAEGLADLIDAETQAQRRQALRQAGGALLRQAEYWRTRLIATMALVEAAIDFSDEDDVASDALRQAEICAEGLKEEIVARLDDEHRGEIVREGFRVALLGPPNAGKSSLLNALALREAAIVSDEPGTTRDPIEVRLDIGGQVVIVTDTAGLREASGLVEREGIRRSIEVARRADLAVMLFEAGREWVTPAAAGSVLELPDGAVVKVASKADLMLEGERQRLPEGMLPVSVKTGEGLAQFIEQIGVLVSARAEGGEPAIVTQARHRQHLEASSGHLAAFLRGVGDIELRAEDLRLAAAELGRLVGRVDAEDVLGQIFSRFCIGK